MKKTKKFAAILSTAAITASLLAGTVSASESAASEAGLMNPPVVETEKGSLRGYMDDSTYAFLGIPYAVSERFGMPEEVEAWDGVRDAQAYGPVSPIPAQTTPGSDEMV